MPELDKLAREILQTAEEHGWYDGGERNFGEVIALCHSELSEALEEWRVNPDPSYVYYRESDSKPEGIAFEMADTLIRVLDWFAANDLDPDYFVRRKMSFNETRPYRHGNKLA